MASEKAIDARIQKRVKDRGGWSIKYHGGGYTNKGIPDRLICYRGRFIAAEVKKPGAKPTPLQEHELEQIRSAGGIGIVVSSVEEVDAALDRIDAMV